MICNFMIFSESVGSGACLSAKKQPAGLLFLRQRERDENPGGRYRAALSRRSRERIPLSPLKSSPQGCFFLRQRERDENPGVRYRAALSRRSRERLPLSPQDPIEEAVSK